MVCLVEPESSGDETPPPHLTIEWHIDDIGHIDGKALFWIGKEAFLPRRGRMDDMRLADVEMHRWAEFGDNKLGKASEDGT